MKAESRETTEHEALLQGQDWHADVQRDGLPEAPCDTFSVRYSAITYYYYYLTILSLSICELVCVFVLA